MACHISCLGDKLFVHGCNMYQGLLYLYGEVLFIKANDVE